jgi:ribosome-binding protein aMBF1 (putative translation factor)
MVIMAKKRTTSNAVRILHKRYINGDSRKLKSLRIEREKANIAEQIYNLRTQAGLTQKQLARLVSTTQSVISRLESADYNGRQTLSMLQRIATSLQQRIEVRFVPEPQFYAHV